MFDDRHDVFTIGGLQQKKISNRKIRPKHFGRVAFGFRLILLTTNKGLIPSPSQIKKNVYLPTQKNTNQQVLLGF